MSTLSTEVRQTVVGIGEAAVSSDPDTSLVTYALGSCLGIAVHDATARVGGLLHVMLPDSAIDPTRAAERPFMFLDTGLLALLAECQYAGARTDRLTIKVAGGASFTAVRGVDSFRIGHHNLLSLKRLLGEARLSAHGTDTGGSVPRTMSLCIEDGSVLVRTGARERRL